MAKIVFENISKIFGVDADQAMDLMVKGDRKSELREKGHTIGVNQVDFEIKENEFFVIMGLSGSGKSTLVRHINGLMIPTSGRLLIDGDDVTGYSAHQWQELRRYKVSMVFQKFGLLPHKSVIENVAFGLVIRGETEKQWKEKARHWINKVGLSGYEHSMCRELSGGMQQRVGIARALAVDTDILLMDEPFSALDPLIRKEMQDSLLKLKKDKEIEKTVVFVTHHLDEAIRLADRMAILKDGELIQLGTPQDIVNHPNSDYVRAFVEGVKLS